MNNRKKMIALEVRYFLEALITAECKIVEVECPDDEEIRIENPTFKKAVELVSDLEESLVWVSPSGSDELKWIRLILGNGPGYLVNDYEPHEKIDAACHKYHEAWSGGGQPDKTIGLAILKSILDRKELPTDYWLEEFVSNVKIVRHHLDDKTIRNTLNRKIRCKQRNVKVISEVFRITGIQPTNAEVISQMVISGFQG